MTLSAFQAARSKYLELGSYPVSPYDSKCLMIGGITGVCRRVIMDQCERRYLAEIGSVILKVYVDLRDKDMEGGN